MTQPDTIPTSTTYSKYSIISFFHSRRYNILTSYQDIIEADFIETLFDQEQLYRKKGQIFGLTVTFLAWDTLFKRALPLNKIIFGFLLMKISGELVVHMHLDEFHTPLSYIYYKYYYPKLIETNLT